MIDNGIVVIFVFVIDGGRIEIFILLDDLEENNFVWLWYLIVEYIVLFFSIL